ncbi:uncharacterized protein BX663DRAFT_515806 [Cokeromyces recurvatus]|uniref:uncharacterized protein n=1 Tax=Cokeromyces recurvatus TaxID=90255 RepID=UPI00221EE909|nr:uncharacterized protein BX663DRAFT_515806 [Cokeromyces recurvatus]KAI7900946.1 hypothetical protein BX663DRAFT_515806 [Cokeromyces recurvatus]
MDLISLPDQILIKITSKLSLQDLLSLGDSHTRLRSFIYESPEIWTSNILFPKNDRKITDIFIQLIIPRITRHYGILSLRMIQLPSVSWKGYFLIFDQFAHSVKRIHIELTNTKVLWDLAHHLAIFAGYLVVLQKTNQIPITFKQYYALHDEERYAAILAKSKYLGQHSLEALCENLVKRYQLDDPPFERLELFDLKFVSVLETYHEVNNAIRQIKLLSLFLSGHHLQLDKRKRGEDHGLNNESYKYIKPDKEEGQLYHHQPQHT